MDKNEDRRAKNKARDKIQGVSMLPFGLIAGFAGEKEIRITELAENGFIFRTAEKIADPEVFRVCFYHYPQLGYEQVELHSYVLECSEKYEFYYEYTLYIDNTGDDCNAELTEYRKQVRGLLGWYDRYIRLKLLGDSEELAGSMTAYPKSGDVVTAENFEEQKKAWFLGKENSVGEKLGFEYALELDNPWLYEEYLAKDLTAFMENYWKENHLSGHWLSHCPMERLYIGNSFCHLLFPKEDQLFLLLEKAKKEGLKVTLTFSYIREFMLEKTEQLLKKLEKWCEENKVTLEIQVNDWALAKLLMSRSALIPVFGVLLNKRKKDPRLHYKTKTMEQIGTDADKLLSENNLNADFYREYLKKEYGIERYEWESCGYNMAFPPGKNSLHLPFYQTNTSQYCTLYAKCTTGERGVQKLPGECPEYCQNYAFLYPDHLKMVGKYNSLFALDGRIFTDKPGTGELLKNWKNAGVDRLVLNLLSPGGER